MKYLMSLFLLFSAQATYALSCAELIGSSHPPRILDESLEQKLPEFFNVLVQRRLADGNTLTMVDGGKLPPGPSFPNHGVRLA
ncbi:MAG: hypothetical protein EOP06_15240, partial [Proteobacteria bacterium]